MVYVFHQHKPHDSYIATSLHHIVVSRRKLRVLAYVFANVVGFVCSLMYLYTSVCQILFLFSVRVSLLNVFVRQWCSSLRFVFFGFACSDFPFSVWFIWKRIAAPR